MREDVSSSSKATIRGRVRAARAAMSQQERERATAQLTQGLMDLAEATGARTIACYSSRPNEPDTGPFIDWARARETEVLLPMSLANSRLDWVRCERRADLAPGRHGILEPVGASVGTGALAGVDLVLVPACAVDAEGTRLGWGMGYYDRGLAGLPPGLPVYAVVFDDDYFLRLPRDSHDVPVTGAVTPRGIIEFHSGAQ